MAVDLRDPDIIYVGTSNGAYRTDDGGSNWKRIFTGWGKRKNISYTYINGDGIFLCTGRGLFTSRDNGRNWRPAFGIASRLPIFSVAVLNNATFIATDDGVYESLNGGKGWKRVFSAIGDDSNDEEDQGGNDEGSLPKIRAIATSFKHPSRIYLGTEDGIYVSEDKGGLFKRFPDEGLLDKKILFVAESPIRPHRLYAVTKRGIFYFDGLWHTFESGCRLGDFKVMAFDLDPTDSTWIVTKRGVYKSTTPATDEEKAELETSNLLDYYSNEPTINEVQGEAIKYAEVYPEKIANWRRRANMSAILPRVSFGIDESESDTYEIYTSSSKQYYVKGPKKDTDGWDITLTWDLSDLIWNGANTLIDVRSKLMVQLRDDILDEVNSYYFERRRLQIELLEAPPNNKRDRLKKELRIRELTANLDGLTGGYFSRKLYSNN